LTDPGLKKTALNAIHRQLGARMMSFAGWDMPVQYEGPLSEHFAVRTKAGVFDVSHMGELEVKGPNAAATLQRLTCNDVDSLAVFQCQYSALTTPQGTFIDDLVICRKAPDRFFLCVNAANQEKDFEWIRDNALPNTEVIFRSHDFSQLAIQGPRAQEILQPLTGIDLSGIRYYWFAEGKFAGVDVILSRTGYTGEDGFEVYCSPVDTESVFGRIMDSGRPFGLQPAGLAARNTLRLEAGMLLYGNDMDSTTTVLEAGLKRICKLEKGAFVGRDALLRQRESGLKRALLGFEMIDRGIARDHYTVQLDGKPLGKVTSGSPAPFLRKNIGLAYLPTDLKAVGTELSIIIRDKPV
jgi:aminomethyltransferase